MKNFPHQFNNLDKLLNSLKVVRNLINLKKPLKDETFGEELTKEGIYTYRNKSLTIQDFLLKEQAKPKSNRGYLTVSRDIRRLFELLGLISLTNEKNATLSQIAKQLLSEINEESRLALWRKSFLQLSIETEKDKFSHPYKILLKLVQKYGEKGIETKKLMLALEAVDDSENAFRELLTLSKLSHLEILKKTGTSESMAKNAVKILPGIAEQLGDIVRIKNMSYTANEIIITEDDISTTPLKIFRKSTYSDFRQVTADTAAKDPQFKNVETSSIDYSDSIKIRQARHAKHQEIVRALAMVCEENMFCLYEGKFDLFAKLNNLHLLFEVKTITSSKSDQEKQVVKGIGQLRYYKHSIVEEQMKLNNSILFMVLSQKPKNEFIKFLIIENVNIMWQENKCFRIISNGNIEQFNPKIFN